MYFINGQNDECFLPSYLLVLHINYNAHVTHAHEAWRSQKFIEVWDNIKENFITYIYFFKI